jgi:hypothetical protein
MQSLDHALRNESFCKNMSCSSDLGMSSELGSELAVNEPARSVIDLEQDMPDPQNLQIDQSELWPAKGTQDYKDCVFLTEAIAVNPYCAAKGQTEEKWQEVARNVAQYGDKLNMKWRSIRERITKLLKDHTDAEQKDSCASGVSQSYCMKKKLLVEIASLKDAGSSEKDLAKEAAEKLEEAGRKKRDEAMQNRRSREENDQEPDPRRRKVGMADVFQTYFTSKVEMEKEISSKKIEEETKLKKFELEISSKKIEEETKLKTFELDLKERELRIRERELDAQIRERELNAQR